MEFIKYMHIERFGTLNVEGIEEGICWIFPKIDGTNSSVWLNDDMTIGCGSRKRILSLSFDNAGFMASVLDDDNLIRFVKNNPGLIVYGEFLVPHALKTYEDDAWRKFYVFDVLEPESGRFLPYDEYSSMLDEFNIEYIPPICKIKNPTYKKLIDQLPHNTYKIKDGEGAGEGIVIKNYDFVNKFGRITWAKIVTNEFKAKHGKIKVRDVTSEVPVERKIAEEFVTRSLVEKEQAKIALDNGGWESKLIPKLLGVVYHCLVTEEIWAILKRFKNPTINFKSLNTSVCSVVKEVFPEIF